MTQVACIGECMIELREQVGSAELTRGFGGDTLNTAVYLSRLGVAVDYVTALGDDSWSDEMVAAWDAEGVGTRHVMRCAGRVPGLYVIQIDSRGERRFTYWRDRAPARDLFALPETESLIYKLASFDWLYVSGISLSLYGDDGRARLFELVTQCRQRGGRVAFDANFRLRGWPDLAVARAAYRQAFETADVLFASGEDLEPLFGADATAAFESLAAPERILKLAEPTCRVWVGNAVSTVAAVPVQPVDTTAAGDSFAAAYLAARIAGQSPTAAAAAGHRLAGVVVRHPGAVIPRAVMPVDVLSTPATDF